MQLDQGAFLGNQEICNLELLDANPNVSSEISVPSICIQLRRVLLIGISRSEWATFAVSTIPIYQ